MRRLFLFIIVTILTAPFSAFASFDSAVETVVLDHSYADGAYRYDFPNGRGFSASVPNGAVSNNGVSLSFDEGLMYVLTKDGEPVLYESGARLTEDGGYHMTIVSPMTVEAPDLSAFTEDADEAALAGGVDMGAVEQEAEALSALTDAYGSQQSFSPRDGNMQLSFSFRVLTKPTRDLTVFNAAHGFSIESVSLDGKAVSPTGAYSASFVKDGVYTVTLKDEVSVSPAYTVRFEQRRIPPAIELDGVARGGRTGGSVAVSARDGVTVRVFRNGVEAGGAGVYAENGGYRVVAADAAGNTSEAEFRIVFSIPRPVALVLVLALLTAGCLYILHARRTMRV